MRCRLCGWTFLLILGVVPIGCTVDENERPQSIIFDSGPDGGEAIYAVDPKGGEIRRLTPSSMLNRYSRVPDWSPDRTMIAFQSNVEDEEHSDIYVMNADGSDLRRLTSHAASDGAPAWSPDGKKVAFTSDRSGSTQIYVMDADDLNVIGLTHDEAGAYYPAWSPDGTRIAFVGNRDGEWEIYSMSVDGTDVRRLTYGGGTGPAWSPDGKKIAFDATRDGSFEIYVMNTDGANVQRLTANSVFDAHPDWW